MESTFQRVLWRIVLAAALVAGSASCGRAPGRFVVLVVMSTVRCDALGSYGSIGGSTPNLDALAAEGVRFEQAISTSGSSVPAVVSLLTGTWPTIHGATTAGDEIRPLRPDVATAAEVLKGAGYRTAAFVSGPVLGIDRGFDRFDQVAGDDHNIRRADATVDAAIEYARVNRSRSCFLMIHLYDAHLDYDPPAPYRTKFTGGRSQPAPPLTREMCLGMRQDDGTAPPAAADIAYMRGVYMGEVAFVDENIGRLVSALKDMGLYDHAVIVVTSDHGEEFWEHGGFAHGHTVYDELIHVPLIIKLPADVHAVQHNVSWQVRTIDAIPTVFDYLGVAVPPTFAGRSLLEFVRGEPGGHRNAFSEGIQYGPQRISWRMAGYKYIEGLGEDDDGVGELYDWKSDPGETHNLVGEVPDIARRLRADCDGFYSDLLERAKETFTSPDTGDR